MKIIKIKAFNNGAHDNQTINGAVDVPDGWAVILDGTETPNFPFGDVIVDDSVPPVVQIWTPLPIQEPEPEPEPAPTTEDRVAALEAENKTLKAQVSALTDQNDFQEELIVELAGVVYA